MANVAPTKLMTPELQYLLNEIKIVTKPISKSPQIEQYHNLYQEINNIMTTAKIYIVWNQNF